MTTLERAEIAENNGGCATCRRAEPGGKGWVIDHDRSCCHGDISCESCRRGVLCQWCNAALGYAKDDPATLRRLADYLELGTRIASDNGSETDIRFGDPKRTPTNVRTRRTDGEANYVSTSWNVLQRVRAYGEWVAAGLGERLADAAARSRP